MSLISSTNSTQPRSPERPEANLYGQVRIWRARGIAGLLACVVIIMGFVVNSRGMPRWTALSTRLTSRPAPLTVDDRALRRLALIAPTPGYPSTSFAKNVSGVVVASVTVEVNGQLRSVKIVESPDAATGRAVQDTVGQWVFRPLGVPSRATVITGNLVFYFHLRDGSGVVLSSEELQALKRITSEDSKPQAVPLVRTIDEAEFRRISGTIAAVVLDTRSRAAHLRLHRDGAVNIPLGELATRAKAELPRTGFVVIDCFIEQQFTGLCGMAVRILTSYGFSQLAVLNRSAE